MTEEINGVKVTVYLDAKTNKRKDTTQTISYTKKIDGKEVTISYITDDFGQRVSNYFVSYKTDDATTVTYALDDKKKIIKNKDNNIAYEIKYEYLDAFGNKASAQIDVVFDNIPPVVEILKPTKDETVNRNSVAVKWTVNGEVQDTLTLQRLERGLNKVIRRYVDKAGNAAADTVFVFMKEAKDIDIELINPVTRIDQDKVDEYYKDHKYDRKNPATVQTVGENDTIPEPVGIGFKVDIRLPSASPTGGLATLDDIVRNGQIPVDDNGNVVGASTITIPVSQYVDEHCTDDFKKDYKKNGLNVPLYDVTYSLHLWVYTTTANFVNDFKVDYKLNDETNVTSAGTVQMVIDWMSDTDGHVKAKNGHALGTGSYITKLFSTSDARHRCDFQNTKKGKRTVRKDESTKVFGYKRPNK
jgi:ribosomal protein S24E